MRSVTFACALCIAARAAAAEGFAVRAGAPPPGTGQLFISPMGEPFRAQPADRDLPSIWFRNADQDGDNALSLMEMQADASRFFALIDLDATGAVEPDEMRRYEDILVPEIRVPWPAGEDAPPGDAQAANPAEEAIGQAGAQLPDPRNPGSLKRRHHDQREHQRVPQGATLFGILDLPQPVAAADADRNRLVTRAEFMSAAAQRFAILDANGDGALNRLELTRPTRRGKLPAPPLRPAI